MVASPSFHQPRARGGDPGTTKHRTFKWICHSPTPGARYPPLQGGVGGAAVGTSDNLKGVPIVRNGLPAAARQAEEASLNAL